MDVLVRGTGHIHTLPVMSAIQSRHALGEVPQGVTMLPMIRGQLSSSS